MPANRPYERNWRNYYDILRVRPDASAREIKSAYRRLAYEHHPDRTSEPSARAKMNEINEAYEILSNTNERTEYDKAFEAKYRSQSQTDINEENERRSPPSSNKSDSTTVDSERELSWIVILGFFCLLFLSGITICIVRGQINLTGIVLSLLWAVFSFGVIFIGRASLVLMVKFFKKQIRWKDLSGWVIPGFAFLFFAVVISGFVSYSILQMLLFGKLI